MEIALKLANLAYESNRDNAYFLVELCTNLNILGKAQDSIRIIEEFRSRIDLNSLRVNDRETIIVAYASALKSVGRLSAGIEILEKLHSDRNNVVEQLAELYLKDNEPEKTIKLLSARKSLSPRMALWLAKALDSEGDTEGAKKAIEPFRGNEKIDEFLVELQQKTGTSVGIRRLRQPVFIVHGREESTKLMVARFLEKLELEPLILHEKPDKGRTIIEKFENHSSVAFAVVLLNADDVGALASEQDNLCPRARQNVVFEFGYFIGKLGREKVCALYQEGVELPSDLHGVLYVPLDKAGAWRWLLARELKEADLDIDLNKAV